MQIKTKGLLMLSTEEQLEHYISIILIYHRSLLASLKFLVFLVMS